MARATYRQMLGVARDRAQMADWIGWPALAASWREDVKRYEALTAGEPAALNNARTKLTQPHMVRILTGGESDEVAANACNVAVSTVRKIRSGSYQWRRAA